MHPVPGRERLRELLRSDSLHRVDIPTANPRIALAHAALASLADAGDLDALHIKGGATDVGLLSPHRISEDADLLVRPAHIDEFCSLLVEHGWVPLDTFQRSSPFEHSMSFGHAVWGVADVHRLYPGFGLPPEEAFAVLWDSRELALVAGQPCWVPRRAGQALILLLHAARRPTAWWSRRDVESAWDASASDFRCEIRGLAAQLDAELSLALALGEDVEPFCDRRDYRLWMTVTNGGTRLEEWAGRLQAAPTLRDKLSLIERMLVVNPYSLAVRLGRQPTRVELVQYSLQRLGFGVRDQFRWGASGRTQIAHMPPDAGSEGRGAAPAPVERPPRRRMGWR